MGSFLNVVILRYSEALPAPAKQRHVSRWLGGRSHCPHCHQTLRWWELVPIISFMLLRGHCARCRQRISIQYPLVECGLGLMVLVLATPLPANLTTWMVLALEITIVSLLMVLGVIDLRTMLLPDIFVVLLGVVVILFLGISAFGLRDNQDAVRDGGYEVLTRQPAVQQQLVDAVVGAVIGAGFLGLLWLVTRGAGIGLGDVKLMIPLGLLFGVNTTLVLLFLSFIAGGIVATLLLITKRAGMKTAIPFGPFLVGAALLLVLLPTVPHVAKQVLFGGLL